MKWQVLKTQISLILLLASFTNTYPLVTLAQTPPAETYQPGYWQPVARFNPKLPVNLKIINQTSSTIEYGFSDAKKPSSIVYPKGVAEIKNPLIPSYILINSTDDQMVINYKVSVENNVITVEVNSVDSSQASDSTLNLQSTGAIYIY